MSLNFSITASTRWRNFTPEILVDLLHLRFLALLDKPRIGKLDQGLSQHHGDGQGAARVSDPDVVDQVEVFNMLWQGL